MLKTIINTIFEFFKSLGSFGIFLNVFIESMGIPVPTAIGYLVAEELIETGQLYYWQVLVLLVVGQVAGSLISYRIGLAGNSVLTRRLSKNEKYIKVKDRLDGWYAKYGNATIFISRQIGYIRPWSSLIAGFAGVKFWPFIIWTIIGSLVFNILCLYTYSLIIELWNRYEILQGAIIVIGVALFFGALIVETLRRFFLFKKSAK